MLPTSYQGRLAHCKDIGLEALEETELIPPQLLRERVNSPCYLS